MLDIFRGLKSFIKVSHVQTDSAIFRIHYSVTVLILLAFSLIVTTRQYVGNPIDCIHSKDIPEDVVNTFCWIHTTYHVPSAFKLKMATRPGETGSVIYPGIGQPKHDADIKYIKYYQWVCFCLFFQAMLFYIPRWLWKHWEGGKIHALLMDMDIGLVADVEKKQKKKMLLDYLQVNLRHHNYWFYKYFFCELLALANTVGQIFLMNRFFDGAFMTLGLDVIAYSDKDPDERIDPLIWVFPRMTKCTFRKYGPSSSIDVMDVLCILPLNIVNEKVYVFLWFWFLGLAGLTLINNVFRVLLMLSPRMRAYFLHVRLRFVSRDAINVIIRQSRIGDWFLLYMIGQNMDASIFSEVMSDLARRLGHKGKDYSEA
ncbi:innexin shaking-B-like [Amphibalanus amphitrite]|uniref:innexin shaking-B-like n=1 Tax=Amphibalanus amphitrite TaxID=1232801 RepID=UPI001C92760F|nr:innexin shaking-B-like [Amphibalanus amphitrite]